MNNKVSTLYSLWLIKLNVLTRDLVSYMHAINEHARSLLSETMGYEILMS